MIEGAADPAGMTANQSPWLRRAVQETARLDLAVYAAVAASPTPSLDGALGRLSEAANYSRLSIASAAVLSIAGGRRGRAAAAMGLASIAATSVALNLVVKWSVRRGRPDRVAHGVPLSRHVA